MKKRVLLTILILSCAASAFGQNADSKEKKKTEQASLHPHHELTVTAAPFRKAVQDFSVSVSIMDETDILSLRPFNALGALTCLPGIFADRTGDFGRTDIEIRGIGYRGVRLAILVDGRPEKMGIFGCAVTHAFPLDNVERIEVVRGPSSVLFGPDAMAGVINIITRRPAEGFRTDLTAAYGAYDTASLNLRHGAKLGKFDYYFTLDRTTSDGHVPHSSYRGTSFTGRTGLELGSGLSLSLQSKYFDGLKNEPGPLSLPDLVSWNRYKRGSVNLCLDGRWKSFDLSLMVYTDFGHNIFSDGWNSRDHYDGALAKMNVKLSPTNNLAFGVDSRFLGGKSYNSPEGSWDKNDIAAYVYDELVLGRRWILSGGIRADKDSQFGWEGCPQAGVVFKLDDATSLRLSASKAFRAPAISELYLFPSSNPDLQPERLWNFEFGIDQSLGRDILLKAAVFSTQGTNLIELAANPGSFPPYEYQNTGKFTFKGVEIGLQLFPSRPFSAELSYSYLDTGGLTKGRPGSKIDADIRWRFARVQTFLNAQRVSDYYAGDGKMLPIPSYFVVNGRVEFSILPGYGIFAEVRNITAEDYLIYANLPGQAAGLYQMPGRNVHFGLRLGF